MRPILVENFCQRAAYVPHVRIVAWNIDVHLTISKSMGQRMRERQMGCELNAVHSDEVDE